MNFQIGFTPFLPVECLKIVDNGQVVDETSTLGIVSVSVIRYQSVRDLPAEIEMLARCGALGRGERSHFLDGEEETVIHEVVLLEERNIFSNLLVNKLNIVFLKLQKIVFQD